jgi:hypothetical protein
MLRIQDYFGSDGKSYMPTEDEVHAALDPPKAVAIIDAVGEGVSQASQLIGEAKDGPADFLVKKLDPVVNLLDELSKVGSISFSSCLVSNVPEIF